MTRIRIDVLERLLGAADPSALREVARAYFLARGYETTLRDGPHDGGIDLEIAIAPGIVRVAAVSVERNWGAKAADDARKAKKSGVERLWFVTSRRATRTRRAEVEDEIRAKLAVEVDIVDVQDLASLLLDRGRVAEALSAVGAHFTGGEAELHPRAQFSPTAVRSQTAYACALFGADADRLRNDVLENAVLAAVADAGGAAHRRDIGAQVRLALGLAANQAALVEGAIDRLLQARRLEKRNGVIEMPATERSHWASLRQVQAADEQLLASRVRSTLGREVSVADLDAATAAIVEKLGVLLAEPGQLVLGGRGTDGLTTMQERLRSRAREIDGLLEAVGVGDAPRRARLLADLATVAGESGLARSLVAGEVVLCLLTLEGTRVLSALGGGQPPRVVLDASVAIPLLCARLYEPLDLGFFVAADRLSRQLEAYGLRAVLPRAYLEEVASHLVAAYRDYAPILECPDADLVACRNAFVAMYAALRERKGYAGGFASFVQAMGLERPTEADCTRARDAAARRLEEHLRRYGVDCEAVVPSSRRHAEEALARAQRELGVDRRAGSRPPLTLDHDAAVLAWLCATDAESPAIFCTWDRLLIAARAHLDASFDVMLPITLADVLSLGRADVDEAGPASALVAALLCAEDQRVAGASVWARIVDIEQGRLYDAELVAAARDFKRDWLGRAAKSSDAHEIQRAWEDWKRAHLSSAPASAAPAGSPPAAG